MSSRLWRELFNIRNPLLLVGLFCASPVLAGQNEDRWWPVQTLPKVVVRTSNQQEFPAPRAALQMMVQSVAGLAAQAVNERRGDERSEERRVGKEGRSLGS